MLTLLLGALMLPAGQGNFQESSIMSMSGMGILDDALQLLYAL